MKWLLILLLTFATYLLGGCDLLDRLVPPTPEPTCTMEQCIDSLPDWIQDLLDEV